MKNKGIVMEKHRRFIVVLTSNGIFQKAKPMKHTAIGDEINFKPLVTRKWPSFFFYPQKIGRVPATLITVCCVLLVLIMPFYFITGSDKTFAYVNIDINPSVELKIDDTWHVSKIIPLNDDASNIVSYVTDYKDEELETVIAKIMSKSEEKGLMNEDNYVLVGVSFAGDVSRGEQLIKQLKTYLRQEKANWKIAAFQVPEKIRKKALAKQHSMNETMAKEMKQKNSEAEAAINKEDKAIIQSFYEQKDDETSEPAKKQNPDKPPEHQNNSPEINNERNDDYKPASPKSSKQRPSMNKDEKPGNDKFNRNKKKNEKTKQQPKLRNNDREDKQPNKHKQNNHKHKNKNENKQPKQSKNGTNHNRDLKDDHKLQQPAKQKDWNNKQKHKHDHKKQNKLGPPNH